MHVSCLRVLILDSCPPLAYNSTAVGLPTSTRRHLIHISDHRTKDVKKKLNMALTK